MVIILRAILTAGHRVTRYLAEFRWTVLGVLVVTVGIVSMVVAIPYPVLLLEAAFSIVLLLLEIRKNRREARRTRFLPRPMDRYVDVVESLATDDNFRVLDTGSDIFVHDRGTSERMRSPEQFARLSSRPYLVPRQLQPQARRFLKFILANHPGRFKGPCVGWNTDFSDSSWSTGDIDVVAGDHFRFIQSDELAMWDVAQEDRTLPAFGRALFIRRDGSLRNFRDSWLFNLIGASTVAVTVDGRLVGVEQSAANMASPNLLAPSGSGSAEPKDFGGVHRLALSRLAINVATRELSEETGIGPEEMAMSYFLGYGRWLNKAARGELLCVTFLNIDSHAVNQKRIRRSERTYTTRSMSIRFSQRPHEWRPDRPADMLPAEYRTRMSMPLGAALSLLAEEVSLTNSPVRERLLRLPVVP
ncbi:hypothetical protein [Amycolatopsis sp. CA-128772]|uniref:hypothetical protein n=1 Tax=Amycolatopsis sp. CA-128772 TaxID=2073159 RepID=UPI0011B0B15A|nr:hypothetical protein [Amycolatopsis sp. CA-128772]